MVIHKLNKIKKQTEVSIHFRLPPPLAAPPGFRMFVMISVNLPVPPGSSGSMHEFFDKAELQSQMQTPSRQIDLAGHWPELMHGSPT